MDRLLSTNTPNELERWQSPAHPLRVDPAALARDAPDVHWSLPGERGALRARCSLWWTHLLLPWPSGGSHRPLRRARRGGGRPLLERACRELAGRGCSVAVGPMDGSTWRRYRLVTECGGEPAFFLEPDNPDDQPIIFLASGSDPIAHYISAVNNDLGRKDPRVSHIADRLMARESGSGQWIRDTSTTTSAASTRCRQ